MVGSSLGWVKPKTIKLVFAVSHLSTEHYWVRAQTGCLGIRILCPRWATYLHADCCFNELPLFNSN